MASVIGLLIAISLSFLAVFGLTTLPTSTSSGTYPNCDPEQVCPFELSTHPASRLAGAILGWREHDRGVKSPLRASASLWHLDAVTASAQAKSSTRLGNATRFGA